MPVIDLGSVVGPQGVQGVPGVPGVQGIQGNPGPNQVTDQTSTNLNGVLFGSQSRVAVKPVDSTPTADSTNLVSSGGTDKAIKARMPVNGMGKNLLDNWYFQNPVNQRGQSSYVGANAVYTIDRWRCGLGSGASLTVGVNTSGITLTKTGSAAGNFTQVIETTRVRQGMVATLSVLIDEISVTSDVKPCLFIFTGNSGAYYHLESIAVNSVGLHSFTFTIPELTNYNTFMIGFGAATPASTQTAVYTARIRAFKLEFGTEQTLAHQENGVWVLNEIPDYGEELRKCQRYYVSLKPRAGGTPLIGTGIVVANTQAAVTIPLPVTLNGATVSLGRSGTVKLWHGSTIGSSSADITGFVGSAVSDNSVTVTVSVSGGLNIGEVCALQFRSEDAGLSFSCEL